MPTAPANFDDPRYLTELAFKNILQKLWGSQNVYITGDTTQHIHPCITVRALQAKEQLAPGTGIFRLRVQLDLKQKIDNQTAEVSEQSFRAMRQCFYRNDTDPRPMVDLANRLSAAVAPPYTVSGIVPSDEPAPGVEADVRVMTRSLAFDVFSTANR